MKIRIKKSVSHKAALVKPGSIIELDDEHAAQLIKTGHAEITDGSPPPDPDAELQKLRAENEELKARLAKKPNGKKADKSDPPAAPTPPASPAAPTEPPAS